MSWSYLLLLPLPFPLPLTAAGQEVGVCGVDHYRPDVVGVGLEGVHLLKSVVVEHTHQHVVRAGHHPALADDKLRCSHYKVRGERERGRREEGGGRREEGGGRREEGGREGEREEGGGSVRV